MADRDPAQTPRAESDPPKAIAFGAVREQVRRPDGSLALVSGHVAAGFGAVAEEFCRNLADRGEIGAAIAVRRGGDTLVDLSGGTRDRRAGALWQRDTLVPIASATKGLSALVMALAHSRGWIDYDEFVAAYWPEFAQAGKELITVRQLLDHRAGLCALDQPIDLATAADPDRMAALLARQRPAWTPGERQGYHPITLGWYAAELIRRVDPMHRTLGRVLADELAGPLGGELFIGLPPDIDQERLAVVDLSWWREIVRAARVLPARTALAFLDPRSLVSRAYRFPLPSTRDPVRRQREILAVEGPAHGGVVAVRDLALAYGVFAAGGAALRLSPDTLASLEAPPLALPRGRRRDLVLGVSVPFSLGFLRPSPAFAFGSDGHAYGMPGFGGAFGYADPGTGIGFAYAGNRWQVALFDQPRRTALLDALARCLAGFDRRDEVATAASRRAMPSW